MGISSKLSALHIECTCTLTTEIPRRLLLARKHVKVYDDRLK